ncbi:MAG: bifunctional metallophosphatase/5'-nucleotidase [Deltaproteobacteria bacterium]|nr:bifunctional metallophosphatase/5'-nucleotidase [Deltaproteobacteria bacterium]
MKDFVRVVSSVLLISLCFSFKVFTENASQDEVSLTFLQTGDLHGHFLPNRAGPYELGGYARLKTTIDKIRSQEKNVLYFDSGDYSEGTIFFNLRRAHAVIEMLEELQVDVAVLGNHDWMGGTPGKRAQFIEELLSQTKHSFPVLSANLIYNEATSSLNKYIRSFAEYQKSQQEPWAIFVKEGIKIGVIGLSTSEIFYEYLFDPVEIANPIAVAKELVPLLKPQVDILVAVTHMTDADDFKLAQEVEGIDLILGGHSHQKFPKVMEFNKKEGSGKTYVMKTGEYGKFLGRLDASFNKITKEFKLLNSKLIAMDTTVPEDTHILRKIQGYMHELELEYGNIFSDQVAETHVDLEKVEGVESRLGNLISDILYKKAKSIDPQIEFGVSNSSFLSHGFPKGKIDSYLIYDAMSVLHNHDTKENWHLYRVGILGSDLERALNILFMSKQMLNVSYNAELIYSDSFLGAFQNMKVNGRDFDPEKTYYFVGSQGVVDFLIQVNKIFYDDEEEEGDGLQFTYADLGLTYWKILREGLKELSPITLDKTKLEGRVRPTYADFAIDPSEISFKNLDKDNIEISVVVRNVGETESIKNNKLTFYYDITPHRLDDDPEYFRTPGLDVIKIPDSLKTISSVNLEEAFSPRSKKVVTLKWDVTKLGNIRDVKYLPIYVYMPPSHESDNLINNFAKTYYENKLFD